MKFFAIRDKETGVLFPEYRRSYTYPDLEQIRNDGKFWNPRLFYRKQDAKCALTYWRQGPFKQDTEISSGPGDPYGFGEIISQVTEPVNEKPLDERVNASLEVVTVDIRILTE